MNRKIKSVLCACLIVLAYAGNAQAGGAGWHTSLKKAVTESKKTGKPILADFTGSDWCGWCIRLNKEVFSKTVFKKWAKKNVVLLELDYPNSKPQSPAIKKQNKALAAKYKISGFPTILLLGAKGDVLQKTGYGKGGPKVWTKNLDKAIKKYKKTHKVNRGPIKIGYPKIIKKKLYAKNDYRGKKAPKLVFGDFLTAKPKIGGKKQVILIDFWATWCGPCRRLIPELNEFQKTFGKDLLVIGLSDESTGKVSGFMKKTKVNYTMAVDSKKVLKSKLGIMGIPHVMIISSDGIVRWQGFPGLGSDTLTEEIVATIIATDKAKNGWGKIAKAYTNTKCLVSGSVLGAKPGMKTITVSHKGKTYGLCCKGCIKKFKSNPEKYIAKAH